MSVLNLILMLASWSFIKAEHVPNVLGIYDCDVPKNHLLNDLHFDTDYINEKLEAFLDLPFPIDNKIHYNLMINEYHNGKWINNVTQYKGKVCESLGKHIPKLWKSVTSAMEIEDKCPYKQGEYHLKGFSVPKGEVAIPFLKEGRYLGMFTFMRNDIIFSCKQVEINIS